ncbi:hypothetical protein Tco_0162719 [Tanacetum coccineum]
MLPTVQSFRYAITFLCHASPRKRNSQPENDSHQLKMQCPSAVRNVKLHCLADSTNNDHEDEYVRQTNPSSSTRRKSSTERNVRPWSVADRVVPATEVLVVEIHVLVKTAREPVLFITKCILVRKEAASALVILYIFFSLSTALLIRSDLPTTNALVAIITINNHRSLIIGLLSPENLHHPSSSYYAICYFF